MADWKVWCPERGETVDDAKQVGRVDRFREAAEYYAEHLAGFSGDPFEQITLHVLNAGDPEGETRQCTVRVDIEPVFVAGSALLLSDLLAIEKKGPDHG